MPNLKLIDKSYIATPHIAGYSIEGKLNGAKIIAEDCAKAFACLMSNQVKSKTLLAWPHELKNIVRDMHGFSFPVSIFESELKLHLISNTFKQLSIKDSQKAFKSMRANHSARHDFNCYSYDDIFELDEEMPRQFFDSF